MLWVEKRHFFFNIFFTYSVGNKSINHSQIHRKQTGVKSSRLLSVSVWPVQSCSLCCVWLFNPIFAEYKKCRVFLMQECVIQHFLPFSFNVNFSFLSFTSWPWAIPVSTAEKSKAILCFHGWWMCAHSAFIYMSMCPCSDWSWGGSADTCGNVELSEESKLRYIWPGFHSSSWAAGSFWSRRSWRKQEQWVCAMHWGLWAWLSTLSTALYQDAQAHFSQSQPPCNMVYQLSFTIKQLYVFQWHLQASLCI